MDVDVGALLREARERRGISLDDLARATKIRAGILRAIETNRRDDLPAPIYLRAFVRAYAREVGMDPDDAVTRYLDQFRAADSVVPNASMSTPGENPRRASAHVQHPIDLDDRASVRKQWLAIAIVIAIGVLGYNLARQAQPLGSDSTPQSDRTEPPRSPSQPQSRAETGTAGSPESTAAASGDGRILHVEIRASGPCWLAASADGTRVVYRLLQPGEQLALDVKSEAVLRIGDAAAFAYSINGSPGRPLGGPGEPVTVHITTENFREFLPAATPQR